MLSAQTYKPLHFWILFAAVAIMLFMRLSAAPIYILDEAKNAQCAREMLLRHDLVVPTFNGELRIDKPPLHYFFMMLSYKMFGVNEFAARFFSVIMGLLTIFITYYYSKKFLNQFTAFCACIILATSTQFLFEFRLAVPDPYLIFFITLGMFGVFTWLKENNTLQLYIATAAFALATLAKGPVALGLPALCLLIWMMSEKNQKVFFTWHLIPPFILLSSIILPWYSAVHRATNGAWTRGFFIEHNLNRFSDSQEGHGGFFLLTILFILIGLLPFMSFIGEAIKKRKIVFQNDIVRFSGIVVIVFVIFFSISKTKLPNYAMPCYPFAAVILAGFIAALSNGEVSSKKYPVYILATVLSILPVAAWIAIKNEPEINSLYFVPWILGLVPLTFIIYILFHKAKNWQIMLAAIVVMYSLLNIILLQYIYPSFYKLNPVAKTIDIVKRAPILVSYQTYNPGFNFYLSDNIKIFTSLDSIKSQLHLHPDAIIISRKEYADTLKTMHLIIIAEHHDIFELPTTIILKQHATP